MHVCFEFLSVGARGDRSPYSGDGWAALPGLSSPPASHESWLIFIKASPHLFVVRLLPQRRRRSHAAGAGFIPVFLFSFLFSTSLNFIQLNPSLQTVLLDLILTQTCFIFPKPLRHLLRRVPHENVAEDGRSRKRRQTHEKEDPASSIMRFLWVCLCPGGEEGSAAAAVWIWKSKHTLYEHRWCSKDYQALTLSSGVGGWKRLSFTAILIQQRRLAGHYCLSITCILNNASLRLSLLKGEEMFCLQLRAARVLMVFAITVNYIFVILKKKTMCYSN